MLTYIGILLIVYLVGWVVFAGLFFSLIAEYAQHQSIFETLKHMAVFASLWPYVFFCILRG